MPADRVTSDRVDAVLPAGEVAEILAREVCRRNGRDFDGRRAFGYQLVREVTAKGEEDISSVALRIEWNGPSASPAAAAVPRPITSPSGAAAAVELVGMDL